MVKCYLYRRYKAPCALRRTLTTDAEGRHPPRLTSSLRPRRDRVGQRQAADTGSGQPSHHVITATLSKFQSVDQRMRLGMRCRLSPTPDVPSHTSGAAMCQRATFAKPFHQYGYCLRLIVAGRYLFGLAHSLGLNISTVWPG